MKKNNRLKSMKLLLMSSMIFGLALIAVPKVVLAAQSPVNLGTARTYGVLAGSTITNTGPTTITGTAGGDIGLHPGDNPEIETFPGQVDVTTSGSIHLFDDTAKQAKADLLAAYNDAAGRASDETVSGDLAGRTLTPGVYTSASSMGLTGTLTLDGGGDPNAVFIFQVGSTLTLASGSRIVLINDAQACKVFWQVGSSATLGTGTDFVGHIMAMESITDTTGAQIRGQLLAINGAVTLDTNTITNDVCSAAGSLKVTKDLEGSVDGMTLPDFEITVTGPYDYTDTQVIKAGSSYTWEGLSSGTYKVSEVELGNEWSATGTGDYKVQLGKTTEVTVTNVYEKELAATDSSVRVLPKTGGSSLILISLGFILLGVVAFSSSKLAMINKNK